MLKEYKIQDGENVIDIAGVTLGGFDNIIRMIQESGGFFVSVDDDLSSKVTQSVPYDDSLYQKRAAELIIKDPKNEPTTGKIKSLFSQSSIDLCLEAYGDLDNYISFLQVNGINGTNERDMYGKEIIFELSKQSSVRKDLLKNSVRFTTALDLQKYRIIQTQEARITDTTDLRTVN